MFNVEKRLLCVLFWALCCESSVAVILGEECSAFLVSGSDPTDDSRIKHIDFSSPGL